MYKLIIQSVMILLGTKNVLFASQLPGLSVDAITDPEKNHQNPGNPGIFIPNSR